MFKNAPGVFIGTFKEKWRQLDFSGCPDLQTELFNYQTWYNRLRPHQNPGGVTPLEAFQGKRHKDTEPLWASAWDGVLTGYYFPD